MKQLQPTSFHALGGAFFAQVRPQPLDTPRWVARNNGLAAELGLSADWAGEEALSLFVGAGGNTDGNMTANADTVQSIATVYSGHQFGMWAGQLGDGRAHLIGALPSADDGLMELQLKGSGMTPFSRMGDGKAVLRSSIREYLASEAMHGLGVPTTRALCLVGSDEPVRRERIETAAVVTRVAPSFVRFGHFEHFAHHQQPQQLRELADYCIATFYPDCVDADNPYAAFLRQVVKRTAQMVAQWQAVGFCHGVMNTDNMSILGLTIDYGPFQFMDAFVPGHICNHSDTSGRYAYNQQPQIAFWNVHALGQALVGLIDAEGETQQTLVAVQVFRVAYEAAFQKCMRGKLGFGDVGNDAQQKQMWDLVPPLLGVLAKARADYTLAFVGLTDAVEADDCTVWLDALAANSNNCGGGLRQELQDEAQEWWNGYQQMVCEYDRQVVVQTMRQHNPVYVLRNYMAQEAIAAAEQGDYSVVEQLHAVLQRPFERQAGFECWAGQPPEWAQDLVLSCSS